MFFIHSEMSPERTWGAPHMPPGTGWSLAPSGGSLKGADTREQAFPLSLVKKQDADFTMLEVLA